MPQRVTEPGAVPDPFVGRADPSDRLRMALEAAIARFGSRPEVIGIDLGIKIRRHRRRRYLAVRIHVRQKRKEWRLTRRERFPKRILGVPVDVIGADYRDQHVPDPERQTAVATIRPGVSVGALGGETGTLGLLVVDVDDGTPLILGSAHVFGRAPGAHGAATIIQPGGADAGGAPDAIGTWSRADPDTDAAVAVTQGPRPFDSHILKAALDVTGARHPQIGDVLEKSGRTTGITRAIVTGTAARFAGLRFVISLGPVDPAGPPICDFGDSGAVWYDPTTGEVIALHCKGGSTPRKPNAYAIATSLIHAAQALRVRVPVGGGG